MKICSKCNAQMADDAGFCPVCGAKAEAAPANTKIPNYTYAGVQQPYGQQPQQPYGQQPQNNGFQPANNAGGKKFDKSLIVKCGIGAAAIVVVIFVIFFFRSIIGTGAVTSNGSVKSVFKGAGDMNIEKTVNAALPKKLINAVLEECDIDKDYLFDDCQETIDDLLDETDASISFSNLDIKSKKKIDKDDISDLEEMIEDNLDVKINISKAYDVKFKVKYKMVEGDDKESDTLTWKGFAYKTGGNWYFVPAEYDMIMEYGEYVFNVLEQMDQDALEDLMDEFTGLVEEDTSSGNASQSDESFDW